MRSIVRVGGGANQRLALYDGILIKENHIAAAGGVGAAMDAAFALDAGVPIQVEVETLAELDEALAHGAKSILLDNFAIDTMREAVRITAGRAVLGRTVKIGAERGRLLTEGGRRVLITAHPSSVLRLRGQDGYDEAYDALVASAAPASVPGGFWGTTTWRRWSSAS